MKDRMIYMHAAYDCLQSIEAYIEGYDLAQFLQDKKIPQDCFIFFLKKQLQPPHF